MWISNKKHPGLSAVRQACVGVFFVVSLFCDQFGEHFRILVGDLGEHFAVQLDVALVQAVDQPRVGRAVQPGGGVDPDLLESAVVALLQPAVAVGIGAGLDRRDLSEAELALASPHHALGAGHDVLAALDVVGPSFNAWHMA